MALKNVLDLNFDSDGAMCLALKTTKALMAQVLEGTVKFLLFSELILDTDFKVEKEGKALESVLVLVDEEAKNVIDAITTEIEASILCIKDYDRKAS